jgi:hypothetical protein
MAPEAVQAIVYCDGCPTDWLEDGADSRWHTLVFVSARNRGAFEISASRFLRGSNLDAWRQWKGGSHGYRDRFAKSVFANWTTGVAAVHAFSYQEATLRSAEDAICRDLDIGFADVLDDRGKRFMRHQYLTWGSGRVEMGLHVIQRRENQMLPLLLMTWLMKQQFRFFEEDVRQRYKRPLAMHFVTDNLSGDDEARRFSEAVLYKLLRYDEGYEVDLTSSGSGREAAGDYVADNLAGLLNSCLTGANREWTADLIRSALVPTRLGWMELVLRDGSLAPTSILSRLEATLGRG